ncbi:hypothetical protein POM88_020611 [Heracleum sosnowskyi]|uniref:Disease resistance protein At4g27190-like leucine-rich repeats domain-containing protein n=1 Tax=Heracleum sosnowskyi TaxID=360622 RepID=A0AAD8MRN2_9APIA|nr:hypothetical protein POM88_020611 [Heracleum sosnowskyi]
MGPFLTFSQVEFPCLETFDVFDSGEINLEAIDFGRGDSTYQLKILQLSSDKQMHLPCKWKLHLDNLEILGLFGCWWRELKSLHFPNLKELQVNNCGRSALFTISGFRSLKQLQTLRISDCDLLEEIVEDVRGDEHDEMDSKTVIELSQLDSVDFQNLPNLKSFTHGANYECHMPKLKKIRLLKCPQHTFSQVEFPCLERFDVFDCGEINLEAIDFGRGDSTYQLKFLQIRSDKQMHLPCKWKLHLDNLETLKLSGCWWRELKSLHFPNLKELEVNNCGETNLEAIDFGRGDSTYQLKILQLSSDKQMHLPCKWKLHLDNLEILGLFGCWWRELKSLHFPNLKELQVNNCGRSALFTISGFRSLKQLQTLRISDCDLLEEIVEDVRGDEHDEMDSKTIIELSQLDSVDFQNLPNLKSFTHGANYECHMPKLKKIRLLKCPQHTFSQVEFPCLERFDVFDCGEINLEAIDFGRGDSTYQLKFLQIRSDKQMHLPCKWKLHLDNLETLKLSGCWWRELKSLHFPNLKELEVNNCGETNLEAIDFGRGDSTYQLKILRISSDKQMHLPCKWKLHLDNLETLMLSGCWWRELKSLHFPNLKELEVNNCGRSALFTISGFRSLKQLQTLNISDCDLLEEIVEDVRGDEHDEMDSKTVIELSQLDSVDFKNLPNLKSFMGGANYECYMPALTELEVAFPSLNELIIQDLEITDIWGQHYSNDNVVSSSSFCKLKSLQVNHCSKLDSVIPVSMLDRLHNLEDLFIEDCSRLRNAFPPCIARDLIRLERMWISSCEMMTEIIGGADQQKEKDISSDHIIVFPELTKLELVNLKNLTNFWCYQGGELNTFTYKVQFPSLVKFKLNSCGVINLEAIELCRDDSTCPLKSISIKSENHLQLPRKWQLHLYNLEKLKLRHCWWQELKSLCFPELKELQVSNCGRCALFTISGFRSLQQLETLEISNCDLLEEIVEDVRGDGHDEMDKKTVIELLQLDSVILKDLPNLKSFTHGTNYECYMPALDYMIFDNCGLSSLFTCSVFRNLQQLDELVVSNCILLEAIVEDGRGDGETSDANDKIITLLKLYSITLEDLPHLSSFSCSESHAFNMPELKEFHLLKCPRLENLKDIKASTGIVSFRTEHGCEEVTDLNDFITKHRKRGCNLVTLQENQVSNQELETESGIIEEEKHQEG